MVAGMSFSRVEVKHLLKAWGALSLAFAILLSRGFEVSFQFLQTLGVSALTVGLGFLLHELGHKFVAQKYHAWAEFRSFDNMLILAIVMSFFGFIFAAPGAVFIRGGHIDYKRNGKISVAGPVVNYILAGLFLIMSFIPGLLYIGMFGFTVNAWIGLFNMLPFGVFDGKKILAWSKPVFWGMVIIGVAMVFGRGLI